MLEAIRGNAGTGSVDVWTVPFAGPARLDLLTFTVTTSAALGVHTVTVTFTDPTVSNVYSVLPSSSEAGPSMVVRYTYGIGLNPSQTTAIGGMAITDALPDTELTAQTIVNVAAVDGAGSTISGDAISAVIMLADVSDELWTTPFEPPLVPGLLPGWSE